MTGVVQCIIEWSDAVYVRAVETERRSLDQTLHLGTVLSCTCCQHCP